MFSSLRRGPAAVAIIVVVGGLALVAPAWAGPGPGSGQRPGSAMQPVRIGTEFDVLPYATGGAYGSLVLGRGAWRIRGVLSRVNVPEAFVADGFSDQRTDAIALLADRFIGAGSGEARGFWAGGGVEYWQNGVRRDGSESYAAYNNTMLTAGGGYVWHLTRHVYLNPWAAAHASVAGDREVDVSGATFAPRRFTAEASLKLGIVF